MDWLYCLPASGPRFGSGAARVFQTIAITFPEEVKKSPNIAHEKEARRPGEGGSLHWFETNCA